MLIYMYRYIDVYVHFHTHNTSAYTLANTFLQICEHIFDICSAQRTNPHLS